MKYQMPLKIQLSAIALEVVIVSLSYNNVGKKGPYVYCMSIYEHSCEIQVITLFFSC